MGNKSEKCRKDCEDMLTSLNELARENGVTIHRLHGQYSARVDVRASEFIYTIILKFEHSPIPVPVHVANSPEELLGYLTCLRDTFIEHSITSSLCQSLTATSVGEHPLF